MDILGLEEKEPKCEKKPGEKHCPNNKPKANGCGPAGWKGKLVPNKPFWIADFKSPCDAHDVCYGTCGNTKKDCDDEFLLDLKVQCFLEHMAWLGVKPPPKAQQKLMEKAYNACVALAATYHAAVSKAGQKFFDAAQKEACKCCCEDAEENGDSN